MILAATAGAAGRASAWRFPLPHIESAPEPEMYLPPWRPPPGGRALSFQEYILAAQADPDYEVEVYPGWRGRAVEGERDQESSVEICTLK